MNDVRFKLTNVSFIIDFYCDSINYVSALSTVDFVLYNFFPFVITRPLSLDQCQNQWRMRYSDPHYMGHGIKARTHTC